MITVQNTVPASTFEFWKDRTNEMATYFSTCVITTDANASTSNTPGNAILTGNFTANGFISGNATVNATINSTSYSLANSTVTFTLTSPNTVQYGNAYFLGSNGSWVKMPVTSNTQSLVGNTQKTIDSYDKSLFVAAEYLVTVIDTQPSANARYVSKLLTTHDTNTGLITEYSSITTNGAMGTFAAGSNTTHFLLYYTSSSTNATISYDVKFVRNAI